MTVWRPQTCDHCTNPMIDMEDRSSGLGVYLCRTRTCEAWMVPVAQDTNNQPALDAWLDKHR